MSKKKLDIDELTQLPIAELEERAADAAGRVEERLERAQVLNRDLTERETQLTNADKAELEALRAAITLVEHREQQFRERAQLIQNAIDTARPQIETREAFGAFVTAVANGQPARVAIEQRSVTTANAGARTGIAVEALGRPQWLYALASIPFTRATELTISGPKYAALVAQEATPEGQTKPPMTDPALATATLVPFAVTQVVSDQVVRFGVGAQAVTERLASESVFSVNAAIADALEAAAGVPLANAGTASNMADLAIAKVWARTGAKPTVLLVNSADYPDLSDKAAVGPGDGIGVEVVQFNGVPLAVNDAITAGVAVACNGRAFSAHGTDVLLASLPNLQDNTVMLRAETYFALLQHDAGAAVAVDLTS